MTDLKLAVFDVDGTLIDSRQMILAAMERAWKQADLGSISYEDVRQIVGLELTEAVLRLAPSDYPAERIPHLATLYKQAFVELRAEEGFNEPLYEGARETVERLAEAGWLLAVATGKSMRGLNIVFEHHDLHRYFQILRTVDHGPGKPNPFMIEDAMKELGTRPEETLMIGDTSFDMAMARAANVTAHGVSWGFHTVDEIQSGGAHHIHDDFDSLNKALDSFGEPIKA